MNSPNKITPAVRIKVLLTRIGLDGHDRGSRLVASFLRDSGMNVIYTGPWQSIETVLNIAAQEDVDIIGISSLSGDHLLILKLMELMRAKELSDVRVVVGGIVPDYDQDKLLRAGVAKIFHPGSSRDEIVDSFINIAQSSRI